MSISVFRAEREAGLESTIQSQTSVAHAAAVYVSTPQKLPQKALATIQGLHARASLGDADLHFLHTILVSTGWNNNDDVFDRLETWSARATPTYKPFNFEHVGTDIIGVMTSSEAIQDDGTAIADDALVDDLPAKYHLKTGAVLWKHWEDQDKQKRMDRIIAEIAKNEWFVSMECLFQGFDYALKSGDGSTRTIARDSRTAFLTKHLRAYGGSGRYEGQSIGRVLRNVVFSGKGLVRKPANSASIILPAKASVASPSLADAVARCCGVNV